MYVDESGDVGLVNSPSRYYVLTGLVIHELRWHDILDRLIIFRRLMRDKYRFYLRDEIHAAAMITRPGELSRIKRYDRLAILREYADELAGIADINVINIVVDKEDKGAGFDVFERAWTALIQRFENTILRRNFRGPQNSDERGIVMTDNTDGQKLQRLLRKMRHYNPVPNQTRFGSGYRNLRLQAIIEDPWLKDSSHSYFIQSVDLCAYLLHQHLKPNAYMKSKAGHNYFLRLEPILCKVASSDDPMGVVRL
ncbi:MAG: DUF3800 domain-containing protein [Anaerolineae bacterium]|nr:DUF3800 domain-containing protein [Anaerolineae bacterium]